MNLKELQNIIESAKCYKCHKSYTSYNSDLYDCCNSELSNGTDYKMNYLFNIYLPVSEAIAENNKTVIKYLLNCESDDRLIILDAIEDGAKRLNPFKAHKLLVIIRKDKEKLDITHAKSANTNTNTNDTLYKSIA